MRDKGLNQLGLELGIVAALRDKHEVSRGFCCLAQALYRLNGFGAGRELINDEAYLATSLVAPRFRHRLWLRGPVSKPTRGVEHPPTRIFGEADPGCIIKDERDGGLRASGFARHICHRDPASTRIILSLPAFAPAI
ncbi:hypothetical protein GCM10007989_31650 [Devosia pacifica]|uniref:Uncharacterized protein n=1 Tax=Devosia pacifica TaxID=1335967 RepID=A0A918SBM8_9HYPH|nr:hypothetical protein GCM10007989_31650 [Devosia pacifica]